jgi:hypothetical protein
LYSSDQSVIKLARVSEPTLFTLPDTPVVTLYYGNLASTAACTAVAHTIEPIIDKLREPAKANPAINLLAFIERFL